MAEITSKKVAKGFGWVALITYSNNLLGFVTTLILARILVPEQFGAVAVASILTNMLALVKDMGFSEAIIYQKRSDQAAIDAANTLLIGLNLLLFFIAAALAPLMAWYYDNPTLTPVIIVLSTNLVWNAARAVPRALIRKNIDFRRLLVPEVVPVIVSSALSIWMALNGFGVWSLVAKTVVHSVLGMVLMRSLPEHRPRFRLTVDMTAARELMQYGKFIVSTSFVLVVLYNIDRFFVSTAEGIASLGLFELAIRLVEMPVKELSWVVGGVMFPVFAGLDRGDGSQARAILKTLRYVAFVSVPAALAVAIYGPPLVASFFGERWSGMIVPMQVLAGYGMLRSLSSIIHDGFKANGRPELMLRAVVVKLAIIGTLGLPALNAYGLVGICVLIVLTYLVVFVWEIAALARLLNVHLLPSLKGLVMPVLLPFAVMPTIYGLFVLYFGPVTPWQLVIIGPATLVFYLMSIWVVDRQTVDEVKLLARSLSV